MSAIYSMQYRINNLGDWDVKEYNWQTESGSGIYSKIHRTAWLFTGYKRYRRSFRDKESQGCNISSGCT
jgi:hypothetical protein